MEKLITGDSLVELCKKYQIIYADPPYEYRKSGGIKSARGLAKNHYRTMSVEDIKKLPIQNICDKNCYLFLWVTAPCMQDGLDILKAWGFNFFTVVFTWIKLNRKVNSLFWGMGNSSRANPEFVLLGRKGKLNRIEKNVHSVIECPIMKHSKKPDEIRKRIIRLYGDVPRIELFARPPKNLLLKDESYEGWDLWGDEV